MSPTVAVAACASAEAALGTRFKVIELMDSGRSFRVPEQEQSPAAIARPAEALLSLDHAAKPELSASDQVLHALMDLLQTAHPHATVRFRSGSVDQDFFHMSRAPVLVTAGGSFAMCAAIASTGIVRTPASVNINFPQRGQINAEVVRNGWETYAY